MRTTLTIDGHVLGHFLCGGCDVTLFVGLVGGVPGNVHCVVLLLNNEASLHQIRIIHRFVLFVPFVPLRVLALDCCAASTARRVLASSSTCHLVGGTEGRQPSTEMYCCR